MQTNLKNNTASTLVCVLMINAQGIMLSVQGQDYFLSYNRIPWMQDVPIRSVLNVQMSGPDAIVTEGSGHFVTVTDSPDPVVTQYRTQFQISNNV